MGPIFHMLHDLPPIGNLININIDIIGSTMAKPENMTDPKCTAIVVQETVGDSTLTADTFCKAKEISEENPMLPQEDDSRKSASSGAAPKFIEVSQKEEEESPTAANEKQQQEILTPESEPAGESEPIQKSSDDKAVVEGRNSAPSEIFESPRTATSVRNSQRHINSKDNRTDEILQILVERVHQQDASIRNLERKVESQNQILQDIVSSIETGFNTVLEAQKAISNGKNRTNSLNNDPPTDLDGYSSINTHLRLNTESGKLVSRPPKVPPRNPTPPSRSLMLQPSASFLHSYSGTTNRSKQQEQRQQQHTKQKQRASLPPIFLGLKAMHR